MRVSAQGTTCFLPAGAARGRPHNQSALIVSINRVLDFGRTICFGILGLSEAFTSADCFSVSLTFHGNSASNCSTLVAAGSCVAFPDDRGSE